MTSLNRRQYQKFAKILGESKMSASLVEEFADVLEGSNPLYDKEKFLTAVAKVRFREVKSALVNTIIELEALVNQVEESSSNYHTTAHSSSASGVD